MYSTVEIYIKNNKKLKKCPKIITIKSNIVREGRGKGEELWGRGREAPAKNLKKNEKDTLDGTSLTIYARKMPWNQHLINFPTDLDKVMRANDNLGRKDFHT